MKKQPIPFGKYFLLDRINIGGMAEVWRAKTFGEQGFEKLVAIKRILPNIAEDEEFISMFIDEAKITVQLTHANVAQVFDLGKIGESYFIAMEYVAGRDFRAIFDRCRKKGEPAPVPMVCFMVARMCEGLDYAHRKKDASGLDLNIVHRDVSPQNCLVSFEGEVKVIDFGIAKAANKATKTQAGILKGKFGYMSPEQVRGLPLDQRSDVFACGVVLYEMLTGERLFVGESDFSVLEKVRQVDILPPTKYNRRIPEPLEKIVLKALAKDSEDRYQYASDLADALQRFLFTSETVFSRNDLMQYMKSTFAEDVEREKMRQAEYADIKLPAGVAALAGVAPVAPARPQAPRLTGTLPAVSAPPPAPAPPAPAASSYESDGSERTMVGGDAFFAGLDDGTLPGTLPPATGASVPRPPPAVAPPPSNAPMLAPAAGRRTAAPPPVVARGRAPSRVPPGPPAIDVGQQARSRAKAAVPAPPAEPAGGRRSLFLIGGGALALLTVVAVVALAFSGTGTLFVSYEPKDAQVFLDGQPLCSGSPCFNNQVAPGPHEIEIRKEGFATFSKTVDIPRTEVFQLPGVSLRALEIKVSTIIATTPADAEVRIDGKVVRERGRSELYSTELVAGREYALEVSMPGFATWSKKVTVSPDDRLHKELAQLVRKELVVTFASSPAGASVLLNEQPSGTTPFSLDSLDASRPISVVFRKHCFEDATHTLLPGANSQTVEKTLVRKPGCK